VTKPTVAIRNSVKASTS